MTSSVISYRYCGWEFKVHSSPHWEYQEKRGGNVCCCLVTAVILLVDIKVKTHGLVNFRELLVLIYEK